MGQLLDLGNADHAGQPFERVKAAKQFIEQVAVHARLIDRWLKCKQRSAHHREVLIALGKKIVEKLGEHSIIDVRSACRHSYILTHPVTMLTCVASN